MIRRREWFESWSALGIQGSSYLSLLYDELIARYSEPHRHYHTIQHLDECFTRLGEIRPLALKPAEIELALWFHDAVYDSGRDDCEDRSALLAFDSAVTAGVGREPAWHIHQLVMFTQHSAEPVDIDARIITDIDLSILAAETPRFEEYETQIRAEYAWMPETIYRDNRKRVLKQFLCRRRIFHTVPFFERYEQRARANIRRSLERLGVSET